MARRDTEAKVPASEGIDPNGETRPPAGKHEAAEPAARRLKLARFWRKYALLTRGRIEILRALSIIADEESDPELRTAIKTVRSRVMQGCELSLALADFPDIFSGSVRALVESAEKTGAWDEILQIVAEGLATHTLD